MTWPAVIAATALVAAACGDDDDDAADTTAASEQSSQTTSAPEPSSSPTDSPTTDGDGGEPTGEPIKLMVVYDQNPAGSNVTGAVDGAEAAAAAINEDGGVGGRPLEIVACDTQNDPNATRECAQQAVSEGVAALVGGINFLAAEITPVLEQNNIPWIGVLPVGNAELTSPISFPMNGAILEFAGSGAGLVGDGATTLSIARIDIPEGAAFAQFVGLGTQRDGVEVVNDVAIPPGAPDMSSYAAAALENDADGVVIGVVVQDAINLTVALKQADPEVGIAVSTSDPEAYADAVTDALGEDADGIMLMSNTTEFTQNEGWQQFVSDMNDAGYTDVAGVHAVNAYAAVQVFSQIAGDLSEISAPNVLEAIQGATDVRTGLVPPLQFTTGGIGGLPRIFNSCMMVTVLEGGERVARGPFFDPTTGEECPEP